METEINISLDNIANWLKANKLTLNVKKSQLDNIANWIKANKLTLNVKKSQIS